MRVLVACEMSAIVRDEFRARGHDAWSCDILCCMRGPKYHIRDDVLKHLNDGWDCMIAFPPCTHLCNSGSRHFAKKRKNGKQAAAIKFFMELANADIEKTSLENPIGIMSTHYREPDQIIQPWWFGHPETKVTCLWLKGLSPLIATKEVEPLFILGKNGKRYSRIHYMGGKKDDWKRKMMRSLTYKGVAQSMAFQWG